MDARKRGLTSAEAAARLKGTGPNVIFTPSRITFLDILWEEVREPMILLLIFVGILYSILGSFSDAITILVIVVLLILAEVQNEYRAKKAVERLSQVASPMATVVRDAEVTRVEAADVVPGDALVLATGTQIAADGVVASTSGLQVDESPLTGESYPVRKAAGEPVFAGTIVVGGDGVAEVTVTGKETKLGILAEGLKTVKPPRTPLQQLMREVSGRLLYVAVFFSVAIPVIGVLRGKPLKEMVLTGLSLSFATIPEELPIIITMVLGLGAYRLSKKAFLVKRLAAAEAMGAVEVIVTDKTGTLTQSRMTLTSIDSALPDTDALVAAMGAVSDIDQTPLDVALRARAREAGVGEDPRTVLRKRELGVGSKSKSVLRADGTLVVSGAPEEVFAMCREVSAEVRSRFEAKAADGVRLIAVATGQVPEALREADWPEIERDLQLVALLGFSDPPRAEVPDAIAEMHAAGVRTIMVTGDHPATATAVARQVGIVDDSAPVTGAEMDAMDDAALDQAVASHSVFARTTPQHKLRIVEALQRAGLRVAATGDGINDALAIKAADVGIAMGIRGTDVAKDAAGAVLADDNYATIANAIFEGRTFYDNLRKGVKYYLSVKAALIAVFLLPAVFGLAMPFSPIQIILLELFMDLAASAGFVGEPAEPDIRTRKPAAIQTRVLGAPQIRDILLKGAFLFAAVMGAYWYAGAAGMNGDQQRSLAFTAWMIGHVALAFVSRSDRVSLARVGLLSNRVVDVWALATVAFVALGLYVPAVGANLRLVPLPVGTVVLLAVIEIVWMWLLELRKSLRRA